MNFPGLCVSADRRQPDLVVGGVLGTPFVRFNDVRSDVTQALSRVEIGAPPRCLVLRAKTGTLHQLQIRKFTLKVKLCCSYVFLAVYYFESKFSMRGVPDE